MVGTTVQTKSMLLVESDLQRKIVDLLGSKGPMTRGDMVNQLQVARTTIYDTLAKLMAQNVIDKYPVQTGKQGRPKIIFSLKTGIIAG